MGEISVGLQQRVEILKTLYRGAEILILDEPTAVLTPQETEELFAVIRRIVREKNMTVIIITHKLYEVMSISDRVGVMRRGKLVGVEEIENVNEKMLASMMVGREVLFDNIEKTGSPGDVFIEADDLYVADNRGTDGRKRHQPESQSWRDIGHCSYRGKRTERAGRSFDGNETCGEGKLFS